MAPTSKNAKKKRGSGVKLIVNYNGKEVEVCPALFVGKHVGMRNYMAVQDKGAKTLLLDEKGQPLVWKITKIEKRAS